MVTASAMNPSTFGDDHLYFRHERMDNDLALRPEWEPFTPIYVPIFSLEQQEDEASCPFAHLLQYLQWSITPTIQSNPTITDDSKKKLSNQSTGRYVYLLITN